MSYEIIDILHSKIKVLENDLAAEKAKVLALESKINRLEYENFNHMTNKTG